MPAEVSTERLFAFLRALRDTGNATLAAEWAGVSRDWAYKRRKQDPWFDALYREMKAMAAVGLRPSGSAEDEGGFADPPSPPPASAHAPHPAQPAAESPSPPVGGSELFHTLDGLLDHIPFQTQLGQDFAKIHSSPPWR